MAQHIAADDAVVERVYNEARVLYPDDAAWAKHLAERGLDPVTFRLEMRIRYTVEALQQKEADKAKPASDEEARAFYEANPAAFDQAERSGCARSSFANAAIFPEAWANERGKAKAIRERIRRGEDFATLAREFSEDPASQSKGGDCRRSRGARCFNPSRRRSTR